MVEADIIIGRGKAKIIIIDDSKTRVATGWLDQKGSMVIPNTLWCPLTCVTRKIFRAGKVNGEVSCCNGKSGSFNKFRVWASFLTQSIDWRRDLVPLSRNPNTPTAGVYDKYSSHLFWNEPMAIYQINSTLEKEISSWQGYWETQNAILVPYPDWRLMEEKGQMETSHKLISHWSDGPVRHRVNW